MRHASSVSVIPFASHRDKSLEWGRLKAKVEPLLTLGISGDFGSPIWWARALFCCKVDGFVQHTQHVNLRIVGQLD